MKMTKREINNAYRYMHQDMLYEKTNIMLFKRFIELEDELVWKEPSNKKLTEIEKYVETELCTLINKTVEKKVATYKVVKKIDRDVSIEAIVKNIICKNKKKDIECSGDNLAQYIENELIRISNEISFSKQNFDKEKIKYNYFIDLDLQDHFIDYTMLNTLGRKMDTCLPEYLYANRMNIKGNKTLFNPYFRGYSTYSNSLIENVKSNVNSNNGIIVFQIDFTSFYYNINVTKLHESINDFLDNEGIEVSNKERKYLNRIFEIHLEYNEIDHLGVKLGLPLGLKSSGLFANIYGLKIDELFEKERPLFYGRYVDDITIIFKKEDGKSKIEDYVSSDELREYITGPDVKESQNLSINPSKTVSIEIPQGADSKYISEFEKKLHKTGSGFNLIFDPTGIGSKISEIYSNTNSVVTKSSQITEMKKNITSIRMFVGAMFDWYKALSLKDHMKISPTYKMLYKEYWIDFTSCIDDLTLIELSTYWSKLFILDTVMSKEKPLTKRIADIVYSSGDTDLINILRINEEIRDNHLMNTNKTKNMLVAAWLKDFRNHAREESQEKQIEVLNNDLMNLYKSTHKMKNYEKQLLIFERELLNSNASNKFDINKINDISDSLLDGIKLEKKVIKKLTENISEHNFSAFYSSVNHLEDKFKVALSIEKEFKNYYENFLHGIDYETSLFVKKLQEKMNASFNLAIKEKANLIIYPEHGIPFLTLRNLVKKAIDNNIVVMGGLVPLKSRDNVIFNLHITIVPIKKYNNLHINDAVIIVRHKKYLSPNEEEAIAAIKSMKTKKPNINPLLDRRYRKVIEKLDIEKFKIKLSEKIVIKPYICYEIYDSNIRISNPDVSLIALSVNNKDLNTFDHIINTMAIDQKAFVAQANFSDTGGVGIFAPKTKTANRNIISSNKSEDHGKIIMTTLNFRDLFEARYNKTYSKKNNWKPTPPNLIK